MATPLERQIIFKVGGSISCIGSGYIIQDVLRNPDKRSKSIYHRIMVGLSIMDILLSNFAYILGSWPMPKGSYFWAVGNMASCDAAAFFATIGYIGSPLYNCSLATYYSLQLKYNWQDHRLKRIQKWFHIVPCSIALLVSITALCTKSSGPSQGFCGTTILDYPEGCSNEPDSGVKCIRSAGMSNNIITIIILLFPFICLLYVSITMFRVYRAARHIEANALKYSFIARLRVQDRKKTMKRSRRIMIQGVLYCVAMILTWTITFIITIIYLILGNVSPIIRLIACILIPLQGAFNFLIYLIPVFRKMLKTHRLQKKRLEEEILSENKNEGRNATFHDVLVPSSGKTLPPEDERKSIPFEEKEEEKQEIVPLPPGFRFDSSKNGHDDYETRNNENNIYDDGDDDYYQ